MTATCLKLEDDVMHGEMLISRTARASSLLGVVVRFMNDPRREFTISHAQTIRKPALWGDKRVKFEAQAD